MHGNVTLNVQQVFETLMSKHLRFVSLIALTPSLYGLQTSEYVAFILAMKPLETALNAHGKVDP